MARLLPEGDDPQEEMWALLLETALRSWEVLRARARELGLSAPQAKLLLYVAQRSRQMAELATAVGYDPSTLTTMCARLEVADLLERTVDPSDRRARLVALTAEGRALHRRLVGVLRPPPRPVRELADGLPSLLVPSLRPLVEQDWVASLDG